MKNKDRHDDFLYLKRSESENLMAESEMLVEAGDKLMDNKDFLGAHDSYTAAIGLNPLNAVAFHKRGWSKAHNGDIHGELEDWNKAIEIQPDFAQAFADRAVAKTTLKDYNGALTDASEAVRLNPELKILLDPIAANIISRMELISNQENSEKPSVIVDDMLIDMGPSRREFLRNVTLIGVTTMMTGLLSACTTARPAGLKSNVKWGMIIDLKKCVGCKACTIACKVENHTPPGVAYNVVIEEEMGVYPYNKKVFTPRPCMQCENSACTTVCPVKASYHRDDGIVVVDYDKCIGCKYCIAACPYGARSFDFGYNYGENNEYAWENTAGPEYGQYRTRDKHASPIGNVRKCTFCVHRVSNGIAPACATTCMGRAIYFGNLADPEAKCMAQGVKLQKLLATRSYMRLKEELGNEPRVYYLT
jgi:Fe-S-cluster-containing dehydrogenase component